MWMDFYNESPYRLPPDSSIPKKRIWLTQVACGMRETRLYNYLFLIPLLRCRRKFTAITVSRCTNAKPNKHRAASGSARSRSAVSRLYCQEGQLPDSLLRDAAHRQLHEGHLGQNQNAGSIVFPDHEQYVS